MIDLNERRTALVAKHEELSENRARLDRVLERIVGQVALIDELLADDSPDDDDAVGMTDGTDEP